MTIKYEMTKEQLERLAEIYNDLVNSAIAGNYAVFNPTMRLHDLIMQLEMQDVEA